MNVLYKIYSQVSMRAGRCIEAFIADVTSVSDWSLLADLMLVVVCRYAPGCNGRVAWDGSQTPPWRPLGLIHEKVCEVTLIYSVYRFVSLLAIPF